MKPIIFVSAIMVCSFVGSVPTRCAESYFGCLENYANAKVEAAAKKDTTRWVSPQQSDSIGAEALAVCWKKFSENTPTKFDLLMAQEVALAAKTKIYRENLERRQAEAQRKRQLDAPKLEAESKMALSAYGQCVRSNAISMALISGEPAEVVAQAALASCREGRDAVMAIHRKFDDYSLNDEILDIADHHLARAVLVDIIRARAPRRQSPPEKDQMLQGPSPARI